MNEQASKCHRTCLNVLKANMSQLQAAVREVSHSHDDTLARAFPHAEAPPRPFARRSHAMLLLRMGVIVLPCRPWKPQPTSTLVMFTSQLSSASAPPPPPCFIHVVTI
eukprot:GHVU01211648.1.p1 GENE.GHVU01211648.1~~GHVU01211648.1.p1  ORF type:complete len:108 (-),score=9.07 GHVU01211648.1:900-1223(-)